MKKLAGVLSFIMVFLSGIGNSQAFPTTVFINEIHYDNANTDVGEAVEIAGQAGLDLSGWSIVFYNGADGVSYNTTSLTGVIPNQQNGFGTIVVYYPVNGLQNGAPDGLALIDSSAAVVQFLSYEGVFAAVNGPANGMPSVNIGVAESGSTPVGHSLQLVGTGRYYEDFAWSGPVSNTFGTVNANQQFIASTTVPEPSAVLLLASGMVGLAAWRSFRS